MSNDYNLNICQGSSFSLNVTVTDNAGTPINISGYAITGYIKARYSDPSSLAAFGINVINETGGIFNISLTPEVTAALPVIRGVYDVEVSGNNEIRKYLKGRVDILPEVTI